MGNRLRGSFVQRLVRWFVFGLAIVATSCVRLTRDDVFTFSSPSNSWPPPSLHEAEEVELPTAVGRARWIKATNTRGTLVFFNGNGDSAGHVFERLWPRARQLELDLVLFDYRMEGSAAPAVREVRASAREVVERLSRDSPGRPLFVAAHSLGCWFALDAASSPEVTGVVLLAPGTTATDVAQSVLGPPLTWVVTLRSDDDVAFLDGERLARSATRPALIIGSRADAVMPPAFQQRLAAALGPVPHSVEVLDDTRHGGFLKSERVWIWVKAFFDSLARQ